MTGVIIRRGNLDRDTWREDHVETQGLVDGYLQAMERELRRKQPSQHLGPRLQPLVLWENKFLLFKSLSLSYFGMTALGNESTSP